LTAHGDIQNNSQGLDGKLESLRQILVDTGSVLVAFSGGCDSSFLLRMALEVLKDRVAAVTAASPTRPAAELEEAGRFAAETGARHIVIQTGELDNPDFIRNSDRRCYFCKKDIFRLFLDEAERQGLAVVADASNLDDLGDFRPGMDAAKELGIRSPLIEAGFTKQDIRNASKKLGLKTWDKPALACLASRIPYGTAITEERLKRIAACEKFLKDLGFTVARVRYYGHNARIEVGEKELGRLLSEELRSKIVVFFKKAGFLYAAADLRGYRSGSLNEELER